MNVRTIIFVLSISLAITSLFTGCQSSKIAYGNSHYFKQQPRSTSVSKDKVPERVASLGLKNETLLVSIQQEVKQHKDTKSLMAEAEQKLNEQLAQTGNTHLQERIGRVSELATSVSESANRQEKKAKRKEIRQEIKALAKELKSAPHSSSDLDDLDPYLKKAIIFWGIGLVLSIIGAATITSFVWILASIAWLVGSVFFILWLVEELD